MNSFNRLQWPRVLAVVLLLAAAAGWSLATTDYRFGATDDGWQAPMVLHAMEPSLLNRDPLISEVGKYYQSGLFELLAVVARRFGIAETYAAFFVLNRLLMIAAFYYFAWSCTRSAPVAILAAWLLTGYGYYGFGIYLGGTPLLEEKLVPRAFALPFALAGLAAAVCARHIEAAIWIAIAIFIHPVTGANTLGLYLVYGGLNQWERAWPGLSLRSPGSIQLPHALPGLRFATAPATHVADSRKFLLAAAILIILMSVLVFTKLKSDAPLWLDSEWRHTIATYVGQWLFIEMDTAWALAQFPTAVILGMIAIAFCGDGKLQVTAIRFTIGAALACAVHWLGVDRLGFHPLLEACPERATFVVVALAGVGLAAFIWKITRQSGWLGRVLAVALAAVIILRFDYRALGLCFTAALAATATPRFRPAAMLAVLTVAGLVFLSGWPPARYGAKVGSRSYLEPRLIGLQRLQSLGITDQDQWAAENWIREHSHVDELIVPPFGGRGWQIHSQRACTFNLSLHTYVHFSPDLALEYEVFRQMAAQFLGGTWKDLEDYARTEGASWIVTDEPYRQAHPDTPPADFASGPYQVRRVTR